MPMTTVNYPAEIYYPIGTVFSLSGKKFEVRENKKSCEGCGFFPPELELACASHRCSQSHRPDKTAVIFYELESENEEKKMEGKSCTKGICHWGSILRFEGEHV